MESRIRDIHLIMNDIQDYLIQRRSASNDDAFQDRKEHFVQLRNYLKKMDYDGLNQHLTGGISQFEKLFSLNKQRYQSFLIELKLNLFPENESDKNQRLKKLMTILANDKKDSTELKKILDCG